MKRIDKSIFIIALTLSGLGLLMVFSSSAFSSLRKYQTSVFFIKKQLLILILGIIICFIMSKIDYHLWGKFYYIIIGITIFLLIAVITIAPVIHGTKRWFKIGGFSIQPSELAKLGVIIFIAAFLAKNGMENFKKGILPMMGIIGVIALLIALQPSFGVLLVIGITTLILIFLSGEKIKNVIILTAIVVTIGGLFLARTPYAKRRLSMFITQEKSSTSTGQITQSLYGIAYGGIFGKGLGNGKVKLLFLPEPHTDFIFSIIGEELGFVGCTGIAVLFLLLLVRGIKVGIHSPDKLGFLLAAGISIIIFITAILHMGVATGILPTTGLPLPFISYGGSNLVTNLAGIGILLNISKQI